VAAIEAGPAPAVATGLADRPARTPR